MNRESMEFDVLIIGAGPAGLACAIRLAQLNQTREQPLNIAVLEKGAQVGAHILSGAILEPSALNELLPDWQNLNPPLHTAVTSDHFQLLSAKKAWRLPTPSGINNHGNFIIQLSLWCQWLANEAEQLGVNIFPGFAATQLLYDCDDSVVGVQTGDFGLDKNGQPTERFQAGINIFAKQTLLAEGCRGSLSETIIKKFDLRAQADPQTYGIGLKELWRVDKKHHTPGEVVHTVGWPLDRKTYGGGFIYHLDGQQVAIGLVVGLDYQNPYFDPFKTFQQFKTHPTISSLLENGECLKYGARALNEGGWQSIPQLTFPGGMLLGCSAGFVNVVKIKGIHNAMKSGMLAAETIAKQSQLEPKQQLLDYAKEVKTSSIGKELKHVRNVRAGFHKGLWAGLCYAAFDQYLFRGKAPWTFHYQADHDSLKKINQVNPIHYQKPDGKLTFDRLSQVYLSGTHHQEDQPCHLHLADPNIPIDYNLKYFAAPEQRYCPAGVYEIVDHEGRSALQINAANCIHCKTCDIKDPKQNITWVPPEGSNGPDFIGL